MKRLIIYITFLLIIAAVAIGYAQVKDETSGIYFCPYCGRSLGPHMDYGMGPGKTGGRGMMDSGGYSLSPSMIKGTYGKDIMPREFYKQTEACKKFLDETEEIRKELHEKRFKYYEAIRDSKTTAEEITLIEKQLKELQGKIFKSKPIECIW